MGPPCCEGSLAEGAGQPLLRMGDSLAEGGAQKRGVLALLLCVFCYDFCLFCWLELPCVGLPC